MRKVLFVLLVLVVLLAANVSPAFAGGWEAGEPYTWTNVDGCYTFNAELITFNKTSKPGTASAKYSWREVISIQAEDTCTGQTYSWTNEQIEVIQMRNWTEYTKKWDKTWYDLDKTTGVLTQYRYKSFDNYFTGEHIETTWVNGVKQ